MYVIGVTSYTTYATRLNGQETDMRRKTKDNGKDAKGRFIAGNAFGPGRPPRRIESEYLRITAESCSLEEWQAIVRRAVKDATTGNAKAREWLAGYVIGLPGKAVPTLFAVAVQDASGGDPLNDAVEGQKMLKLLKLNI